ASSTRLRQSLIAVFLEHPELASVALAVSEDLSESARAELIHYYTAATLLQPFYKAQTHRAETKTSATVQARTQLPPYWNVDRGLPVPSGDVDAAVRGLQL